MAARFGCDRITTDSASSQDTGKAIAAVMSMTTIGIATIAAATSTAITTAIEVLRESSCGGLLKNVYIDIFQRSDLTGTLLVRHDLFR
jgi:hypothetical protein